MEPDTPVNWALLLEYDGGPFVGWQHQDSGLAVQDVVEAAAAHAGEVGGTGTVAAAHLPDAYVGMPDRDIGTLGEAQPE